MLFEGQGEYTNSAEFADPALAARIEALEDELTQLAGHLNAGNYRFLKLLAEFERRGGHVGVGIASCAHWLSWRCGMSLNAAREKVRVAQAIEHLPKISDAMRRGVLSYCKVRAITRVATPDNEGWFLTVAEAGTVHHVEKVVQTYRRFAQTDELDADNERHVERYLRSYVDCDGMVVIKARLAPEQGAQFMNALRAACTVLRDAERDSRETCPVPDVPLDPPAARNADAVALMAESFLSGNQGGGAGADRALVTIHVDEPVLHDESHEGRCEIEDHSSIPPESARRVLCDASVLRVVEDANGTPMDVGRKTRVVPTPLRRALELRDKQCQYPGCTNARFVDAHHIEHWVDGGETSLANLVLLCRRHHRFVHEYGFEIEKSDAGFEVARPDGSRVLRAPRLAEIDAERGCAELARGNEIDGVEITPRTGDCHWGGESLDCNWVLQELFAIDERARLKSARAAEQAVDDREFAHEEGKARATQLDQLRCVSQKSGAGRESQPDVHLPLASADDRRVAVRPDDRPELRAAQPPENDAAQGCGELARGNGRDGIENTPRTGDSHGGGESLEGDWVLRRLLAFDHEARMESEREAQQARLCREFEEDERRLNW